MSRFIRWVALALPGLLLTLLMFLAQVGPSAARSNLVDWSAALPVWITSTPTLIGAVIVVAGFYTWVGFRHYRITVSHLRARARAKWRTLKHTRLRSPVYIGSSPRAAPATAMTLEEREEIQQLRTLWNLYFFPAADNAHTLFACVLVALEKKQYWYDLARPKLNRLKTAMWQLADAVDSNSEMRLLDVQARQDEAWGAYLDACDWMARIARHEGFDLATVAPSYDVARWRAAHKTLREKLLELIQRPAQADLAAIAMFPDDSLARLVEG